MNVQIGTTWSKIYKLLGSREKETEKVWEVARTWFALWQGAERDIR
jgi:hypothetical protein